MLVARLRKSPLGLAVVVAVLLCLLALWRVRAGFDVIAVLEGAAGSVERDRGAAVGRWEKAAPGAEFVFGDAVKTGPDSRATVLFDRSRLVLEPNTVVRFLDHASSSKAPKLDLEMGSATLEAVDEKLDVDLSVGQAHLEAHTKLRLVRNGSALRFEVMIGSARLLGVKEIIELTVGKAVEILPDRSVRAVPQPESAGALPQPAAPTDAAPAVSAGSPAPAASDAAASAQTLPGERQRGPEPVDFEAGAGESFVIHDARPPTALALTQHECPGKTLLSVVSPGARPRETLGAHRVSAFLPAGTHRYTVSCLDDQDRPGQPVAKGVISVLADSGSRKLPKAAHGSSVETDGRRYTVLYQSLLPLISVTWPNAPDVASYALTVRSSTGTRTVKSSRPSYAFSPGALAEGEHEFTFEASGKHSKPTTVVIRFDNAAPTASIASPADGSFAPGATVVVAGAALPGFRVSAAGRELEQDGQNRFSAEVAAPASDRALAIRFSHPSRGIHYYLKRSAGR